MIEIWFLLERHTYKTPFYSKQYSFRNRCQGFFAFLTRPVIVVSSLSSLLPQAPEGRALHEGPAGYGLDGARLVGQAVARCSARRSMP